MNFERLFTICLVLWAMITGLRWLHGGELPTAKYIAQGVVAWPGWTAASFAIGAWGILGAMQLGRRSAPPPEYTIRQGKEEEP